MTEPETETYYTTAPASYDAGDTRSAPTRLTYYGQRLRKVTVPAGGAQWQTDRYASGLYPALTEAQLAEYRTWPNPPVKEVTP